MVYIRLPCHPDKIEAPRKDRVGETVVVDPRNDRISDVIDQDVGGTRYGMY